MTLALTKGMWLGFCIAAPVGPIGILVLTRAIRSGYKAGLASGLGAAMADFIYGVLAVAGVRMVPGNDRSLGLAGGLFLLWLAWKSWRDRPVSEVSLTGSQGTLTTFMLTISNPMTILSFAAMVASSGTQDPVWFVAGVFAGSMLWWTLLSATAAWLRSRIQTQAVLFSRLSALTLASFGVWAIWSRLLKS